MSDLRPDTQLSSRDEKLEGAETSHTLQLLQSSCLQICSTKETILLFKTIFLTCFKTMDSDLSYVYSRKDIYRVRGQVTTP